MSGGSKPIFPPAIRFSGRLNHSGFPGWTRPLSRGCFHHQPNQIKPINDSGRLIGQKNPTISPAAGRSAGARRPDQREVDIYSCIIHNLFDEYRFFPKYPEKELQITACLFGGIIAQGQPPPRIFATKNGPWRKGGACPTQRHAWGPRGQVHLDTGPWGKPTHQASVNPSPNR